VEPGVKRIVHCVRGRLGDEQGSVSVELVIVAPVFIVFLLFVVALGSLVSARINVDGAAAQAARAASLADDPSAAATSARQTATSALGAQHVTCAHLTVAVDTTDFQPGGSVAVTVTCSIDLSEITGISLPATEAVSDRSVAPIDRYRSFSG
jgi:Flp pilus assembly protein TadG